MVLCLYVLAKTIKFECCFVRAVQDENELQYIVDNQDYIKRTIKGGNRLNEIVNIKNWFLEHYQKANLIVIDTLFS